MSRTHVISMVSVGLLLFWVIYSLIQIVADYDLAFTNADNLFVIIHGTLTHGLSFTWKDFGLAFDGWAIEESNRPRFLNYFLLIVNYKFRLWLWQYTLPHPSFSPIWIITHLAGPVLLYVFIKEALDSRLAALSGVVLYLSSTGGSYSLPMLFHMGKPVLNVAMIIAMICALRMYRSHCKDARFVTPRLSLSDFWVFGVFLFFAFFLDETAVLLLLPMLFWCHRFFLPPLSGPRDVLMANFRRCAVNGVVYSVPVLGYLLVVLIVVPIVLNITHGREFDLLGYMEGSRRPEPALILGYLRHTVSLFAAHLLPWEFIGQPIPLAIPMADELLVDYFADFALPAIVIVVFAIVVWRGLALRGWRSGFLVPLVLLAITTSLFYGHVLKYSSNFATITGAHYGGVFSVLFAVLVATIVHRMSDRKISRFLIVPLMAALVTVQLGNLSLANDGWRAISDRNSIGHTYRTLEFLRQFGDWSDFDSNAQVYLERGGMYAYQELQEPPKATVRAVYDKWKKCPKLEYALKDQDVSFRLLWLAVELHYMAGRTGVNFGDCD